MILFSIYTIIIYTIIQSGENPMSVTGLMQYMIWVHVMHIVYIYTHTYIYI